MTVAEVQDIRAMSPAADGPAWSHHWGEMARKTVAKRHAKILPMSSEARAVIDRDNEPFELPAPVALPKQHAPEQSRPRLADQFDALGEYATPNEPKPETEKRTRGRPRKAKPEDEPPPESASDELIGIVDRVVEDAEQADMLPATDATPDYDQGRKDAMAGRVTCLNPEIKSAPYRYREWQRGFNSVKK
jgi:recombination protein RecT